jgi:hypothetical protein
MKLKRKRLWGKPRSRWESCRRKEVYRKKQRRTSFGKVEIDGKPWLLDDKHKGGNVEGITRIQYVLSGKRM